MASNTHINVTVDFRKWGWNTYDLRIPLQISVKQLLLNLAETLKIDRGDRSLSALKITTKDILLTDEDSLIDYPVSDGDILKVL
ncbi:EsaB/YukD family protein [Oceanobacillus sp. FSL W7-1293]|uniref:EsaB/YukD family protein n=1 Tax=Oceanobacillus sp. FSL W7-1293 TaxID=2921699 RepID=UPI0030CF874D